MNRFITTGKLIKVSKGKQGKTFILVYLKRPNQIDSYISIALNTTLDASIQINDTITVIGLIRGYNTKNKDGKWQVIHYFEASHVELAQSELKKEFGVEGHYPPKHEFMAYAEGKIRSIANLDKKRKTLIMAIYNNEENPDMITVIISDNVRTGDEFNLLKKGDTLDFTLNVQTYKKTINNEERKFTNLIVRDFTRNTKISHNEEPL